jgi:DNA polymerase eta
VAEEVPAEHQPIEKRRKVEDSGLRRFFNKPSETVGPGHSFEKGHTADTPDVNVDNAQLDDHAASDGEIEQVHSKSFRCPRCGRDINSGEEEEHNDWHFAKDLETQERQAARSSQAAQLPNRAASGSRSKSARGGRGGKSEKGQTRLTFG